MSKLYTDFDLSFKLNANGDVSDLSDVDCIRASIINSINLESFDIPFNDWYAPNIKYQLFEQQNKIAVSDVKKRIIDVLNLDPRLRNPSVEISYGEVNNVTICIIDITVYVVMLNKEIKEQLKFERVR